MKIENWKIFEGFGISHLSDVPHMYFYTIKNGISINQKDMNNPLFQGLMKILSVMHKNKWQSLGLPTKSIRIHVFSNYPDINVKQQDYWIESNIVYESKMI